MVKLVDKQNIFNSGILSSKLYSRDDLKQYSNGVSDALNFICSRYGPLEKRTGTSFIWDLENPDDEVFFLPFVFSIKQSLLLEFLNQKIRFYTFDGVNFGPIADPENPTQQYEIETPFTASQLDKISFVQSLDVIYLAFADRKTPPYTLSRYANNDWRLAKFVTEDGPYLDQNYSTSKKMRIADPTTGTSSVILTGLTLSIKDVGRWIRICTPRYNENTYAYEDKWSYGKISSYAGAYAWANTTNNKTTFKYTKTSTPAVNTEVYGNAAVSSAESNKVTAYDSSKKTITVNSVVYTYQGPAMRVKWSYRNIVDEEDQSWMTAETSQWRLGVWHTGTGNNEYPVTYPTKVSIHQQRLVWAGMTDKPWIWTSNSFAYKNYAPSDYEGIISDTNSISYDVSTDKVSDILWMKSVKYLLIGTELGELRMYSSGTALSPSDVVANRESSYGSHNAEPVANDDNIVFIQRLQRTIRALSYDDNKLGFVGPELTVLAESLTAGGIKKIVFQKEPNNTYWCLKEDGTLLTLTYDSAQDVIGWSRSALAGSNVKIIDLAVLPSSAYQQDMLLLAVEREVEGVKKRYLELLSKNFINDVTQKDSNFLDCSVRITSEDYMTSVDGLDFLEGETVRVMDEGAILGDYVVEDGTIQLDSKVKDIRVGLPYKAHIETLERDFQDKQISTKMSKLRVYKLRMYLERTLGVNVRRLDNGSETMLFTFDPSDNTDTTPSLITGKVNIEVPSAWDCDYRLRVESEPGLPCILAGLIIGVEINEL